MNIRDRRRVQRRQGHEANVQRGQVGATTIQTARHAKTGKRLGLTIVVPKTQLGYSSSFHVAAVLQSMMRPIRVAPIKIFNGVGRQVAVVEFNRITGSRHRLPVPPLVQGDR